MSEQERGTGAAKHHNRVGSLSMHVKRYAFRGTSRLASDAGVSKSTISRLIRGHYEPLYTTAKKVIESLELRLGRRLDFREVFSDNGTYPTEHICELVGCPGCLPDRLFEPDGRRRLTNRNILPGSWTGDNYEFDDGDKGGQ